MQFDRDISPKVAPLPCRLQPGWRGVELKTRTNKLTQISQHNCNENNTE